MFLRRASWARVTKGGLPPLFVLNPLAGFTPAQIGSEYPAPEPANKVQLMRARQMYEQRRVGTRAEADFVLARQPKPASPPVSSGKEKKHGSRSPQNAN